MPAVLVDIEVRKKVVVHGAFVAMRPLLEVELPFRRLVLQHLPHARTHAHTNTQRVTSEACRVPRLHYRLLTLCPPALGRAAPPSQKARRRRGTGMLYVPPRCFAHPNCTHAA